MRNLIGRLVLVFAAWALWSTPAVAQNVGAKTSGDWSDGTIWTTGTVPGSSSTVYIGSNTPSGSAGTVTVTVSTAESAATVNIGDDNSGGNGTLILDNALTISGTLSIGLNSGVGGLQEGAGGSFSAANAYVYNGNSLNLGLNDAISGTLGVYTGATVTTAATGNVATGVQVYTGGMLNLGANMTLTGTFDAEGAGTTINLNNHALSAGTIELGYTGTSAVTLNRGGAGGTLTAGSLDVGNTTFNLLSTDKATNFNLINGTSTVTGTVTGGVSLSSASTLNLGANMTLTGTFNAEGAGTTVNLNNNALSAGTIELGYTGGVPVTLNRGGAGGTLTAGTLDVGNTTFNLLSTDKATTFNLINGTSTVTGTVTGSVSLSSASTLNLGANMTLTGTFNAEGAGTTINLNNHALSAGTIELGYTGSVPVTLNRGGAGGTLTAGTLDVGNTTFNLLSTDKATTFNLINSTSTVTGTVTGGVSLSSASTLNLGANMTLSGTFNAEGTGTTVNLNNNALSAGTIELGYTGGQAVTLNRGGPGGTLTAGTLDVANTTLNLQATDSVASLNLNNATSTVNTSLTGSVGLTSSTLSLGVKTTLTGDFTAEGTGVTVNLNGNALSANTIDLGYNDGVVVNFNRGGAGATLTATTLEVAATTFNLPATDKVVNFSLNNASSTLSSPVSSLTEENGSTATTTTAGNVNGTVTVTSSTLNLGAKMTLGNSFNAEGAGTTINLNGFGLNANTIELGYTSTVPVALNRGGAGGILTANTLEVGNMPFNLAAPDSANNFYLNNVTSTLYKTVFTLNEETGSNATTTAGGNVTGNVTVTSSTLNLGAAMTLSGTFNAEGAGTTINLNGLGLSANTIELGYTSTVPVALNRGGAGGILTATNLEVGNMAFNLAAPDSATNFYLNNVTSTLYKTVLTLNEETGSNATTTTGGNVTGSVSVTSSTLNLGTNMTLTSNFVALGAGTTINLGGYALSAPIIELGYASGATLTLNRGGIGGTLSAPTIEIGNSTIDLLATDSANTFSLLNATSTLYRNVVSLNEITNSHATTTAGGTATGGVEVYTGSTLNLGANMTLTGTLDVRDTGSTVNLNGYALNAATINLGYSDGEAVTLNRGGIGGTLTTPTLNIGNSTINLLATDSVTNLTLTKAVSTLYGDVSTLNALSGSTATTTSSANVANSVEVYSASTLNLGANLALTGNLDVRDTGSTVNGHGFGLTSNSLYAGYSDGEAVSLINLGTVEVNNLYAANGSTVTLHGGDVVNDLISLTTGSTLTVSQTNGIGLTLNGNLPSSLTIDPSQMVLDFAVNATPTWDFRWADPTGGGNWVSTIESMINAGEIVVNAPNGYTVIDQNGYTYVEGNPLAVPEPSTLVLACIASLGVAIGVIWNRRRVRATRRYA